MFASGFSSVTNRFEGLTSLNIFYFNPTHGPIWAKLNYASSPSVFEAPELVGTSIIWTNTEALIYHTNHHFGQVRNGLVEGRFHITKYAYKQMQHSSRYPDDFGVQRIYENPFVMRSCITFQMLTTFTVMIQ